MTDDTKTAPTAPQTVEAFSARLADLADGLPKRLRQCADHVAANLDRIAVSTVADLAAGADVPPSAVMRFCQILGFSGFSEMQRLFREGLAEQIAPGRAYELRVRDMVEAGPAALEPVQIADEFLKSGMAGMQQLRQNLDGQAFDRAVELLAGTQAIWIAGSRRSFPVAVYLEYALQHTDKRIGLFSALGSMQQGQIRSVRSGDVMIAISFMPYADETVQVAQWARQRSAHLIAMTDSRMSPIAREAEAALIVQDSATFGFRALTAAMGLAQSLFVALAYRLELSLRSSAAPGSLAGE